MGRSARSGVFAAVADNRCVVGPQTDQQVAGYRCPVARSLTTPEAFGAIFDRHFPAIYRYLARRVGRDGAEDLAAQTFVVAFERRANYRREVQDARPWLYGIATNLLANDRRAEQRMLQTVARLGAEQAARQSNGAAVDSDWDLASALARLDADQRDVLFLHVGPSSPMTRSPPRSGSPSGRSAPGSPVLAPACEPICTKPRQARRRLSEEERRLDDGRA